MEIFKKYITAKNIIFAILAILCIVFITKIKDIAILFFASYVIACSLNPIVDKLSKKVSRGFASGLVLGGGLLVGGLVFIPIIAMAGHEIKSFVHFLPKHIANVQNFLAHTPFLDKLGLHNLSLGDILPSATGFTSTFVNESISFSIEIATAVIYSLAACIIIFYFMSDKEVVKKFVMSLFPRQMKVKAEEILETISQKIGGYVIAQLVTISSVGIIMFLGLWILKIDYALLLGLLTSVFDIVPIVGPALALVVILLTVYKLGAVKVALVIAVFAFAQWAENNLIRPYIFSKFLDLHPLIIYFFLFVTAQYLGVIGVIFAPAIAATVCVLVEELYIKNVN